MKINRDFLKGVAIGLTVVVLSPLVALAARTAAPVLTGLFSSSTLSINLPAPSISLGSATTSYGSVYNGTIYFAVTALDGVGETVPSQLLGTSTALNGAGWNITWTPVQGASGYRVYYSTSTPQAMIQYFTATTSNQFTFLSTSSPTVYIPGGINQTNSAYVINIASAGNSWVNGGKVAIGTTTQSVSQVTIASSTAPQLSITDVGSAGWAFRALSGTISIASTTPTGVTGGPAALSINTNGYASFGTTTTSGNLNLSTSGSSAGSTTITGGKLQFDVANAQGAHSCVMINGIVILVNPSPCTR